MDIEQLLAYTHQIQYQNSQLKKHIFNIQQQLQQKNQLTQLNQQKNKELNEYIKLCQNEIVKRQSKQLQVLEEYKELKMEMEIYIEQIDTLKNQLNLQKIENQNLLKDISRRGNGVPPKADLSKKKYKQNEGLSSSSYSDNRRYMYDNSQSRSLSENILEKQQCNKCIKLLQQNKSLQCELQKQKTKVYQLQTDIECLVETISYNQ